MTVEAAVAYLHALPRFADQGAAAFKPGLERMRALLAAMGDPHASFPSVHVAGTNGKGSTASLLSAIGTAAGLRIGLHTSPHLVRLNERLRLDGVPAPDDWLADAVGRFRAAMDDLAPSFFEATTALSFLYFAEREVDAAVVEVGLGGRLDATNVLQPRLAIITHIGLDHTDLLGDTLAQIAREKAGIIEPEVPVLTAVTAGEALDVVRAVAADRNAPLHVLQEDVAQHACVVEPGRLVLDATTPHRRYEQLEVGLTGEHQATNALLAVRAAELVWPEERLTEAVVRTGLRDVRQRAGLRGRLEVVQEAPLIVADVAHNPDGIAAALAFLREAMPPAGTLHVMIGLMRDKDVCSIGRLLAAAGAQVHVVALDSPRGVPPSELRALLTSEGAAVQRVDADDPVQAFKQAAGPVDALLVTGSHQIVGRVLRTLDAPAGG
ncbi:MAG: bifunctional folylpolyglutamate synthase/dihydrofolate synthase [Bacteroidetes bacterium]|jgi:dihydrofolate synthase/folylpolyglutamate synthase|nr:bifunctional folylpolyglutamate synthase/dihydrofolate synthase [Bacteroidota bacterium]